MLGWSINLFRIRGIQLSLHFSFLLLLAYVAGEGWNEGAWPGVVWNTATFLAFFTCVVLHELGHSFMARHFGVGVSRILLMPIGGMAEFDSIPRQPSRELLITLAGPAVNFAIAGLLWFAPGSGDDENVVRYSLAGLLEQLFFANLVMGCFNLLPIFPMDGGRIFRALLAMRVRYLRATRWAANTGKALAAVAICAALGAAAVHYLPLPQAGLYAALFAFIVFAGEVEYRAVKRREIEDAHWRATMMRFHEPLEPAEEPPLLAR